MATDEVFTALESTFRGFERGPIEMVDQPGLARSTARRVRLPYEGPDLHEMWTATWANADLDRSTICLERKCGTCGTEFWDKEGLEYWENVWDPVGARLVRTRVPRVADAGIYLSRDELGDSDIFRVRQFPAWVLCTDAVRDAVRSQGFTNVDFLGIGELT